ncbi:Hypothetical_protein [Hexamita inflata]|uniref:Hypothetical_protein n=1 Tax=Hexamita inflata TaxID=28002 RepID=A0AA86UCQ6_9EUKA|nr:Hypothetical protein HINF_LOCUS38174 [Hexamita inflata]
MQNSKFCNSSNILYQKTKVFILAQLPFNQSSCKIQFVAESIQISNLIDSRVAVHVIKVNYKLTNHSQQNTYQFIYTTITVESSQLRNWRKYLKNQFWGGFSFGRSRRWFFVWRIFSIEEHDQRSNKQAKQNKIIRLEEVIKQKGDATKY